MVQDSFHNYFYITSYG